MTNSKTIITTATVSAVTTSVLVGISAFPYLPITTVPLLMGVGFLLGGAIGTFVSGAIIALSDDISKD